ncbi:MAG: hypothetical protein LUD68_08885 [Rikenellaceae bacterium]|nr:hypothetical protein [Rikenellaceae bacterium]
MKNLLLLLLCLGAFNMNCFSQTRSIQDYGKTFQDTLLYLKYNFEDNKEKYIGQTVKSVLDDYELPFLRVYPSGDSFDAYDPQLRGLNISFLSSRRARELSREGIGNHTLLLLFDIDEVRLEPHLQQIQKINDPKSEAYYFKDYIIKDIILSPIK